MSGLWWFQLRRRFQGCLGIGLLLLFATAPIKAEQEVDYFQLVNDVHQTMMMHHYDPQQLNSREYQHTLQQMRELAQNATSKEAFIAGFNNIWQQGPFSHVMLTPARGTAEQLAQHLDTMRVGEQAVQLEWDKDTAVLTVNTMMGVDTIEAIQRAYQQIAQRGAKALIIDLRQNEGGAFATRPLVSHLISQPVEAGYFVSQKWTSTQNKQPTTKQLADTKPWDGWSILAFWHDLLNDALIKVRFAPSRPQLDMPVYVLTSNKTASASELALDALRTAGRVKVIGEATAGKMLSQKPFDLPGGFHLFLPIADYYSVTSGRLEGNPIQPDITVAAKDAMAVAKKQIAAL